MYAYWKMSNFQLDKQVLNKLIELNKVEMRYKTDVLNSEAIVRHLMNALKICERKITI